MTNFSLEFFSQTALFIFISNLGYLKKTIMKAAKAPFCFAAKFFGM
jgi:hypothetical protein